MLPRAGRLPIGDGAVAGLSGVLGGEFPKWRIIAARDGALNIYHFGCSLDAIKRQLPACPTFNQHIDSAAIRDALKAFNRHFPNTKVIRHAIAHAGEMQKSPSKIRENMQASDKTWHGGSSAAGSLLLGGIYERTYTIGWKNDVFSLTLNQDALKRLSKVRRLIEEALNAATSSLAGKQPPRGN